MLDFLLQTFEARLVEVLQASRYAELETEDLQRILRSVEPALGAASLAQGARDLMVLLDDRPDLDELVQEGESSDAGQG